MRRAQGSIQRWNGGWRVFATVHDENGCPRRTSKVVRGSRKDAENALALLLRPDYAPIPKKVGEICDMYLADLHSRVEHGTLEPSTLRGYAGHIENHIRPALGSMDVSELRPFAIKAMLDSMPSNSLAVFKTMRQMLRWAMRMELISSNPMERMQSPPSNPPSVGREDVYSVAEVREILSLEKPPALEIAVALALGCGLRRGEICGLDWEDYDGEHISVTKAYGKTRPKTLNGIRTLGVPSFTADVLDAYASEGAMVRTSEGRVHPDTLSHLWRRFLDSNPQVRRLPFKNLRHTSLSLMHVSGVDLLTLSRVAGHASVSTTDRFYARVGQEVLDGAAERLGGLL